MKSSPSEHGQVSVSICRGFDFTVKNTYLGGCIDALVSFLPGDDRSSPSTHHLQANPETSEIYRNFGVKQTTFYYLLGI